MFASPKSFSLNSRAEAWPGKSFVCSICGERGRLARAGRSLYPWNDASKATWICPEGTYENSPTLQRWESEPERVRPEGTAEMVLCISRPFRDCWTLYCLVPNAEALGYSQPSLRDAFQILVASDVLASEFQRRHAALDALERNREIWAPHCRIW